MSRVCEAFGVPLVAGGAVDQPLALTRIVFGLRALKDAYEQDARVGVYESRGDGWAPDPDALEFLAMVRDARRADDERNAAAEGEA